MSGWPLSTAITEVKATWAAEVQSGSLSAPTVAGYARNLDSFRKFASIHEVSLVDHVSPRLCQDWIHAPVGCTRRGPRARQTASSATRRGRQTALRRAVSFWLEKGIIASSPLPSEVIYTQGSRGAIPLTPLEVSQLRLLGRLGPRDTLRPAMVEAALAGASQQSIARLVVTSFDATQGVLHLPGSRQTYERDLQLTGTAVAALRARVADLTRSASYAHLALRLPTAPLLVSQAPGPTKPANPSQVVASNLKRALAAAGVNRPDVTAGSLQAYAANARYAKTNRVEDVAELLGLHSLDRAMAKIDHQWQSTWADQVRNLGDR